VMERLMVSFVWYVVESLVVGVEDKH
jgi:hypothetical protein